MPDQQEACYSGPPETLEVGVCKSGVRVCLPSGSGFGECGGDVVPKPENCLTPEDEACNGDVPTDCPTLADGWLQSFGSTNFTQVITDVAITNTGDIVVVGGFADTLDFGLGPIASTGSSDIFIAKFDPFGKPIWNKRFGDASPQIAMAVAVDNTGAIYVGGSIAGSADFEGTLLTSAGGDDAFLARFDPDGKLVKAQNFGDSLKQTIREIEITKTNLVVVAGEFAGVLQLDANNSFMSVGSTDIFVARFDTSGFVAGARAYGGSGIETLRGMALDSGDQVYLTGGYEGTSNFGGTMLTSTGSRDAYVARLAANLNAVDARGFGNPNGPTTFQEGFDVAVGPGDEVFFVGGFSEAIDVDGTFLNKSDALSRSIYVAKFGPQLASPALALEFGSIGGSIPDARIAIDGVAKQIVLAGSFAGDLTFGGPTMNAPKNQELFLAKLALDGAFVASRTVASDPAMQFDANNFTALALLPSSGDIVVGGVLRTPILQTQGTVGVADPKNGNAMLGRFLH